jgi:hypothetical protein
MFDNYIEGTLPEFIANFTNLTDLYASVLGLFSLGTASSYFCNLGKLMKLSS